MNNNIMVWVNALPTTGFAEMFQAKLPQQESWYRIEDTLRMAVDIHVAGEGYKQGPGGKWKYQLLSSDRRRVIRKACTYLVTDEDYLTLVDTVKGRRGKERPVAVLTQEKAEVAIADKAAAGTESSLTNRPKTGGEFDADEGRGKKSADEEVVWYEGPMEAPLDENGSPYFDPYDPLEADRVVEKWSVEHPGFMD